MIVPDPYDHCQEMVSQERKIRPMKRIIGQGKLVLVHNPKPDSFQINDTDGSHVTNPIHILGTKQVNIHENLVGFFFHWMVS